VETFALVRVDEIASALRAHRAERAHLDFSAPAVLAVSPFDAANALRRFHVLSMPYVNTFVHMFNQGDTMKAPIESKVLAATGGAGLGGAFGTFVLWLLGVTFWHSSAAADQATTAVASVPEPVGALIVIVVAGVGALISGYVAPHTSRPDLHPAPAILGKALVDAPADPAPAVEAPAPSA
jgi:hypothetical protein